MVKVTELMGAVPEGNDAKTTFLRTLHLLHKVSNPIIYSGLYDVRSALRVNMDAMKKAHPALPPGPSWTAFGAPTLDVLALRRLILPRGLVSPWAVPMGTARAFSTSVIQFPTFGKPAFPKLSPEQIKWMEVQEALEQGDEDPFWRFVEKQLGRPPDDLLRKVLNQYYLPHGGIIPTYMIFDFLDHHRRRLDHDKPEKWHAWLAEQVYERLRKHPNHRLMRALRHYSGSPHERLKLELPSAVKQGEHDGYYGGYFGNPYNRYNRFMLGDVERQIVHADQLLRNTHKRQEHHDDKWDMVVSLDVLSEHAAQFEDTTELEEQFARLEDERRDERSKGLPPKERELLHFFRYVYNQEEYGDSPELAAARYLAKAPSTVRSQVYQMKRYFAS
jgi:hypothetical protein